MPKFLYAYVAFYFICGTVFLVEAGELMYASVYIGALCFAIPGVFFYYMIRIIFTCWPTWNLK